MTDHDTPYQQAESTALDDVGHDPRSPNPGNPWTARPSFRDLYRSGDLPWPREPYFPETDDAGAEDGGAGAVVAEYVANLRAFDVATTRGDERAERRLRGEIEAAEYEFREIDTYQATATFEVMRSALTLQIRLEGAAKSDLASAKHTTTASEAARFIGPAPLYRRGRAYVQAFFRAAEGASNERVALQRREDADQLLEVVEATTDTEALQDFIAGMCRELERQLKCQAPTATDTSGL